MNRQEGLYQIEAILVEKLPSLGRRQALGLAVLVLGLVSEGWIHLSRIAEGASEGGGDNTVRQRAKRWVSNRQATMDRVKEEWVGWVWAGYGNRRAVLLVDETKLGERLGVMMVSLAYGGAPFRCGGVAIMATTRVSIPNKAKFCSSTACWRMS